MMASTLRCSAFAGKEAIASRSTTSDQTCEFRVPGSWSESQSDTMPVPERWMKKPGFVSGPERETRPAINAWMDGSWSELPQSES